MNGVRKLVEDLPVPFQLGEYDPKTQSFDVKYLDTPSGKFQPTEKMSLQDAVTRINQVGEKEFVGMLSFFARISHRCACRSHGQPVWPWMAAQRRTGSCVRHTLSTHI